MDFQPASNQQLQLFPYDLDQLLTDKQAIKDVSDIVDQINLRKLAA